MIDELKAAQEDIDLAPEPHTDRKLHPAEDDIRNAYNHLVTQQQPQQGEGDNTDPFAQPSDKQQDGEGSGEQEETPKQAGGDRDLRRSENGSGDLRDQQLDQLGREARRKGGGSGRGSGKGSRGPREQH